ncbi:hypothetical protein MO973_30960 [Paenibacillus sp. TRM 82003]|nr:hypothetical protein [Paenibacillus sp. TRM 82003]
MKPKSNAAADERAAKELRLLQERLGLEGNLSPDQLRDALKGLASKKVIADYKIKNEKS